MKELDANYHRKLQSVIDELGAIMATLDELNLPIAAAHVSSAVDHVANHDAFQALSGNMPANE